MFRDQVTISNPGGKCEKESHSKDLLNRTRNSVALAHDLFCKVRQIGNRIYGVEPTPTPGKVITEQPLENTFLPAMQKALADLENSLEDINSEIIRLENFA